MVLQFRQATKLAGGLTGSDACPPLTLAPLQSSVPWPVSAPRSGICSELRSPLALRAVGLAIVAFDIRLLYAGHPLQPVVPPVPLQCPPPGHDPSGSWSAATKVPLPLTDWPSELVAEAGDMLLGSVRGGSARSVLDGDRSLFKLPGRNERRALR